MKVLHLLSSTGFHGGESMTAELVRELARLRVECHVGIFDNDGHGDRYVLEATRASVAGSAIFPCRRQFDLRTVLAIRRYAVAHRIDVVHSHKYKTTFHALLARSPRRFGVVATYHNWLYTSPQLRLYAAIDKRLARWCDAAVGVSRAVTAELARFARPERVSYVPNGVCTDRFMPGPGAAAARAALGLPERPTLGFVGRLTPMKGLTTLLEAAAALAGEFDLQLVLVGDGESRPTLEAAAARAPLAGRVHFLGHRADTQSVYRAMDAFVLPSLQEAFPMVVLEAMACGVPVVATDVGDVSQLLGAGEFGTVVTPGSLESLREALRALLNDAPRRAHLAAAGRQRVVANYSGERMARTYASIYESIGRPTA